MIGLMDTYPKFKRGNLVDRVFEALRTSILSGRMKEGERFPPQSVLADEFGVSRTVIREAHHKLSSLGLVKSEQGRGTFVSVPDSKSLLDPMLSLLTLDRASTRELLEARYYIEGIVAKLATERATQLDMSRLKEIFAAMEASAARDDVENFSCHDNSFHKELAIISKNSMFCRILETLCGLNDQFLIGFTRTPGAIERAVSFHRRILAAVTGHDAEGAQLEMNEHMKDIIRSVKRNYDLDISF